MKVTKMTRKWGGGKLSTFSVFAGSLMMCASALATATYTYENDNKTYVATVTSAETAISAEAIAVLNSNAVTNFIKSGDKNLTVYSGGANAFTGDVMITNAAIVVGGSNPLGPSGKITVDNQRALVFSKATVAKDVLLASGLTANGNWNENTKISVWAGSSRLNGKFIIGKSYNSGCTGYDNSVMTFAGGVVDEDPDHGGYMYFKPSKGSAIVIENKPMDIVKQVFILPNTKDYPLSSDGFAGRFVFSVAGNKMMNLGYDNGTTDCRLNWCQLKTTVDWAFDTSRFGAIYFGHDSVWDLCGTSQRIGQLDVKVSTGNPSVITNSSATPSTLYMKMPYGPNSSAPNIRIGGNLSVVFEKNIWATKIDYPMTATGDLIVKGDGGNQADLNFLSNGSWVNATNVVVEGNGKITIANPNALGRKANVSLKSNSSLSISSGVTVNVRTLTINGIQQPRGDYTFGSGTLRVSRPCGLILSVQ